MDSGIRSVNRSLRFCNVRFWNFAVTCLGGRLSHRVFTLVVEQLHGFLLLERKWTIPYCTVAVDYVL